MKRKKLVSRPLDKLKSRILGIKAIQEDLVLSNGLSVKSCNNHSDELQTAIDDHFIIGTALDEKRKLITSLEKKVNAVSKKILTGVINDFGDDSPHVNKVGGVPTGERAKPTSAADKAAKVAKKTAKKA